MGEKKSKIKIGFVIFKKKWQVKQAVQKARQDTNNRVSFTVVRSFIIISILTGQKEPSALTGQLRI